MDVQKEDEWTRITLEENLVAGQARTLRTRILDIINEGNINLILDMDRISLIDSAGLGVLISSQNSLKSKEGSLKVVNVNTSLMKIFKIMRLDKHFEVNGK